MKHSVNQIVQPKMNVREGLEKKKKRSNSLFCVSGEQHDHSDEDDDEEDDKTRVYLAIMLFLISPNSLLLLSTCSQSVGDKWKGSVRMEQSKS